jgi:hypothetical protein
MNRFSTMAGGFALAGTVGLSAAARVGEPAPNFSNIDTNGKTPTLSELKGKWVVLECHNPAASSRRSTTTAAICPHCRRNGPPRASRG